MPTVREYLPRPICPAAAYELDCKNHHSVLYHTSVLALAFTSLYPSLRLNLSTKPKSQFQPQ